MSRKFAVILVVALISVLALTQISFGKDIVFDPIKGTLGGYPILELTPQQVTSLFGKPENEEPEKNIGNNIYFGAKLYYPQSGIWFQFNHSVIDSKQRCVHLKVYLAKESDTGLRFNSYSGTIANGISSSWSVKNALSSLAAYKPTDRMTRLKGNASETVKKSYSAIDIKRSGYGVAIMYSSDKNSLEDITIMSNNIKYKK